MRYYHAAPLLLEPGSVVLPGNWGRIQSLVRLGNGLPSTLFIDYIVERERKTNFPEKPSRLNCCYVCPYELFIHHYIQVTNKNTENIYEVEIVDKNAPMHTTCWNFKCDAEYLALDWVTTIEEQAKLYWSWSKNQPTVPRETDILETLIASPIRIIRRLEHRVKAISDYEFMSVFQEVLSAK